MKTIKQPDLWSCVLCCVQMATHLSRQELLKAIGRTDKKNYKSGLVIERFVPIMATVRIFPGITYIPINPISGAYEVSNVQMDCPLQDSPAFLSVQSHRLKDKQHLIFWDGNYLRDPNPDQPEISRWEDYTFLGYTRLTFWTYKQQKELVAYYR